MNNAQKFALKKYPVKVIKRKTSIDVNAIRRKNCVEIYNDIENEILDRASAWLRDRIGINKEVQVAENGEPLADSYIEYAQERLKVANEIINEFRNYMKGE